MMDSGTVSAWIWSGFIAAITLVGIGMAIKLMLTRVDYTDKSMES